MRYALKCSLLRQSHLILLANLHSILLSDEGMKPQAAVDGGRVRPCVPSVSRLE